MCLRPCPYIATPRGASSLCGGSAPLARAVWTSPEPRGYGYERYEARTGWAGASSSDVVGVVIGASSVLLFQEEASGWRGETGHLSPNKLSPFLSSLSLTVYKIFASCSNSTSSMRPKIIAGAPPPARMFTVRECAPVLACFRKKLRKRPVPPVITHTSLYVRNRTLLGKA